MSGNLDRPSWALTEHPIISVVVVALLARVVVGVAACVVTDGYTIPDETLYVELARSIVHGVAPNEWYPGYGQSFYDSVGAFSAPLVFLFRIFGSERLVGAMFSAVVGAAAAGVTVAIALRFLRPTFAVVAGLIVALLPSQVLFSAVVLREGHIWLALTVVGLGAVVMASTEWLPLVRGLLLAAMGLLGLGFLRDQTLLAAAWALGLAVLLMPRQLWFPRVAGGVVIIALVPWVGGAGFGAVDLVTKNAESLAKTRATLAVGANTAFGGATAPPGESRGSATSRGTVSDTAREAANRDESIRAGIEHLPAGLVDVTLRPFPWQSSVGLSLLMARVENVAWYVLYALSLVGIVSAFRRRRTRLALQFPVLLMGLLVGIAALTQGNLGTAFRHRDQMVWSLALCAAAGLQWITSEHWPPRLRREEGGDAGSAVVDDGGVVDVRQVLTGSGQRDGYTS